MGVCSTVLNLSPQKNDAVLAYRILAGRAVVVDLVHGTLNTLNATATRIWELVEENISAKEIAERLTEEFEVSLNDAIGDVVETLQNMASIGWIRNFPNESAYVAPEDK